MEKKFLRLRVDVELVKEAKKAAIDAGITAEEWAALAFVHELERAEKDRRSTPWISTISTAT